MDSYAFSGIFFANTNWCRVNGYEPSRNPNLTCGYSGLFHAVEWTETLFTHISKRKLIINHTSKTSIRAYQHTPFNVQHDQKSSNTQLRSKCFKCHLLFCPFKAVQKNFTLSTGWHTEGKKTKKNTNRRVVSEGQDVRTKRNVAKFHFVGRNSAAAAAVNRKFSSSFDASLLRPGKFTPDVFSKGGERRRWGHSGIRKVHPKHLLPIIYILCGIQWRETCAPRMDHPSPFVYMLKMVHFLETMPSL